MLRDKLKDKKYFDEYLSFQENRIKVMKDKSEELDYDNSRKNICLSFLSKYYKDYINALYSYGKSYTELRPVFLEYIDILSKVRVSSYSDYIDAISMSIIFDTNLSDIKIAEDYLNDKMIKMLLKEESDEYVILYPEKYKVFANYLDGLMDIDELKTYMTSRWYDSCKDLYWYDSHKSSADIYTGYWSWIAGACMKIKGENSIHIDYVPCFN